MIVPLFGQYYINGYLEKAIDQGHDAAKLLAAAGIRPSLTSVSAGIGASATEIQYGSTISYLQLQKLWHTLFLQLDDHNLGFLELPGKVNLQIEICRVISECHTLQAALERSFSFLNAVRHDALRHFDIDSERNIHFCEIEPLCLRSGVDEHLFQFMRFCTLRDLFSWFLARQVVFSSVHFRTPKPPSATDYELCFGCPVYFSEPYDRIYIGREELTRPIGRHDGQDDWSVLIRSGAMQSGHSSHRAYLRKASIVRKVEDHIVQMCRASWRMPSIDEVANTLNVSSRTLRRRLSAENESWSSIKTRIRCERAIQLLVTTNIPIKDIAHRLGFTEPGDFSRAFVNWTGSTPSLYRQSGNKVEPQNTASVGKQSR